MAFSGRTQAKCIRRANAHAQLAASAVPGGHLNAVLVVVQNASSDSRTAAFLERCRGFPQLLRGHQEWSHSCMGADQTALVALRALVHVYLRHLDRNATLLVLTGTTWHAATRHKGTHRQRVCHPDCCKVSALARQTVKHSALRGTCGAPWHKRPCWSWRRKPVKKFTSSPLLMRNRDSPGKPASSALRCTRCASLRVDCQGCPSSWNFAFHDARD